MQTLLQACARQGRSFSVAPMFGDLSDMIFCWCSAPAEALCSECGEGFCLRHSHYHRSENEGVILCGPCIGRRAARRRGLVGSAPEGLYYASDEHNLAQ